MTSLQLGESLSENVEAVHSLADDFANPHWFVKAMRKVSIFGRFLARRRMLQSAQVLLEAMPDYCKNLPIETHRDVQRLLAVASTLERYDVLQYELLQYERRV